MSGPITVVITASPIAALLSAAAIRAAQAVYQGYAHAATLHEQHQQQNEIRTAAQSAAQLQGRTALGQEARSAEVGFDQLQGLAERLGVAEQVRATRPAPPDTEETEALVAYVQALQALSAELRAILLTEAARQSDQFAEQAVQLPVPDAAPRSLAQRLLLRIHELGDIPQHIQSVAQELDGTLPGERAELLATELRSRIQAHIEDLQQQQVQRATATIVEQSLKDLGYQVEEVGSTLFVEGGVVHFRRQSWGNYMVRMRVNAQTRSVNFNVVRAVSQGQNERSVLDHLAEDRWCTEFPELLKALEVRGVHLDVTRRLAAGELPVQLVDADKLPRFADEDASASRSQLQQRELK